MHHANIVLLMIENTRKCQEKKVENREYHTQDNEDDEHQDVKMYCTNNQFTQL